MDLRVEDLVGSARVEVLELVAAGTSDQEMAQPELLRRGDTGRSDPEIQFDTTT